MIKRKDIECLVSGALLISLALTATLGYIQASLELRRFVPHRYFAYATVFLAVIHVGLNLKKLFAYARTRLES